MAALEKEMQQKQIAFDMQMMAHQQAIEDNKV